MPFPLNGSSVIQKVPIAELSVLRPIKGVGVGERLAYPAQPTWICDVTNGKKGETALFFLERRAQDGQGGAEARRLFESRGIRPELFWVAHSGRGRMPLRELDNGPYATIWAGVLLPESVPCLEDLASQGVLRLASLEALVSTLEPTSHAPQSSMPTEHPWVLTAALLVLLLVWSTLARILRDARRVK